MAEKSIFGRLNDGREVHLYSLENKDKTKVNIINYGAIVTSVFVKDKESNIADVVLGYDTLEDYVNDKSFFGAIVGRYGNRINKGKFKIGEKEYQLNINNGENHLHGGSKGFYKALWEVKSFDDLRSSGVSEQKNSLRLKYVSHDGEQGYPGKVTIKVTYTLTEENELKIYYEGETDKTTILNPTHHSYFNLTGDFKKNILGHELKIDADKFTPVNKELIPTGELLNVENTPMDFNTPSLVGARIDDDFEQLRFAGGYDHNWVLKSCDSSVRKIASVYEPETGRLMEVLTDQPGLQFYSGNSLNGSVEGKMGLKYESRTGLCLETQHFPDSPNQPDFPSVILRPGEIYRSTTIYKFSAK